jgi:hypothetical protein
MICKGFMPQVSANPENKWINAGKGRNTSHSKMIFLAVHKKIERIIWIRG